MNHGSVCTRIAATAVFIFVMSVFTGRGEAADGKIRLGVVGFTSKTAEINHKQADIVTDILTRMLAGSQSILVIEREQMMDHSMIPQPPFVDQTEKVVEMARIMGLQYVLLGSVTDLTESSSAANLGGIAMGRREARATIDARIVDVATGNVIHRFIETGSASEERTAISTGGGFTAVEMTYGGIKERAMADAVIRIAHNIRGELGGEYSYVTSNNGREIVIDAGSSFGAQIGQMYLVYIDGPDVTHPVTGEVLGHSRLPISVVKVKTVQGGFSTCGVANGVSVKLIERGDKIFPINAADVKRKMINKEFLTERPAKHGYDDMMDALLRPSFGDSGGTPPDQPAPVVPDPD